MRINLLQVPLLWTAYAQVSFREFRKLDMQSPAAHASFYQLPSQYTPRTFDEVAASRGKRAANAGRFPDPQLTPGENATLQDLEKEGVKFEF